MKYYRSCALELRGHVRRGVLPGGRIHLSVSGHACWGDGGRAAGKTGCPPQPTHSPQCIVRCMRMVPHGGISWYCPTPYGVGAV